MDANKHLLNVVEGVLRDVGDAHVGVLPDGPASGLQLAGQHLDHGGFAGTVGAQHCHAAVERAEQADVLQSVLLGSGVPAAAAAECSAQCTAQHALKIVIHQPYHDWRTHRMQDVAAGSNLGYWSR